jgi:hypothetical protein
MQTVLTACNSTPSPEFIGHWQGEATTTRERTQLILEIDQQRAFITSIGQIRYAFLETGNSKRTINTVSIDRCGQKSPQTFNSSRLS